MSASDSTPRRILGIAAGVLLIAASAGPLRSQESVCLQDIAEGFPDGGRHPIPVGCQLMGCCPGCPSSGALTLDVRVEGQLIDGVILEFQNIAPATWKQLSTRGIASLLDGYRAQVNREGASLTGFSMAPQGVPPVAFTRFIVNSSAVRKALGDQRYERNQETGRARVVVEQKLGAVVVNETVIDYVARSCPAAALGQDVIELQSNNGNDNAVILVDGRRGSVEGPTVCTNDEIWRAQTTVGIGNVLSNFPFPAPICNQEVVAFSDDDAMAIRKTNPGNLPQDKIVLTLGNLLRAPVTVWVMHGTFANTRTRAVSDLARANQLYNSMNCGTGFLTTAINNATADPDTDDLLNAACGDAANLRARIGFTAGQLNAYYLTDPGARGWWCGNNTVIIGSGADNESLAHEFGHAYSLGHTNNVPGMPAANLMITGGTGRNNLTEGQCFRCNVNQNSTLNTNGVRMGLTRNCSDATSSNICPSLTVNATTN